MINIGFLFMSVLDYFRIGRVIGRFLMELVDEVVGLVL